MSDPAASRRAAPHGIRAVALPFVHALRLRCPACGGGPVFVRWLRILPSCPSCGFRFTRGERGYWLGAYFVNLMAVETVFAVLFVGVLLVTWPTPPWQGLQIASLVAMGTSPFLIYPFSHTLFLAFDILCRPPSPEDFAAPHEPAARTVRRPHA
ncbi:MAG TPA: DUF983 domain-containing protein [Gemmatimonadales bacterium]|nr:DUF983 domain-containing protein [Gemmatimonadales bacterium]